MAHELVELERDRQGRDDEGEVLGPELIEPEAEPSTISIVP